MKKKIGLIVYAYALRDKEPNPCNKRIAKAAVDIKEMFEDAHCEVVVCAQRSVAKALRLYRNMDVIHETVKRSGYEGSEEVTNQAAEIFRQEGVTLVIPVAQTFLHINKCVSLVKKAGFKTWPTLFLFKYIGWIGFDTESLQPGTRGLIPQVLYTVRQVAFGYRYPPELSEP